MDRCMRSLRRTRDFFLNKENVVGVGVGMKQVGFNRTQQPSVIVFVEKKLDKKNLSRNQVIPRQIDGVVTDVIEIGKVRLLDERTDKARPARPGMSIGHYSITAGTFGAVVRDINTGELLILSNNHILANATDGNDGRAALGDAVLQPGSYDGGTEKDKIADLLRFVPLIRSEKKADCPAAAGVAKIASKLVHIIKPNYDLRFVKRSRGSNIIDAALARPLSQDVISPDILEIGRPRGTATVEIDSKVMKSGRSSGKTAGSVTAIGVSLQVELNDTEVGMFSDQVVADMLSRGGDSGSLVLDERMRAVGLLFAGSERYTIFNHMDNVLTKLEIELV
ncbi:MAG: hypothetical protein VR68_07380 [Peptococcaceae bacterium BRH_c4a]|nr:MAG: hypothetical protein VR68_07380 [Peptococcaceae bacterium BRH_c4a]